MNADPMPTAILLVLCIELLFGIGLNALVAWAHEHRLWHVSVSVTMGVAGTLAIAALAWFDHTMPFWEAGLLLTGCFTASGVPMIVGSTRRTVKDMKKRRPWPTAALHARDEVVMALAALANEISAKAKDKELSLSDLPDFVHRLHRAIGMLKSV